MLPLLHENHLGSLKLGSLDKWKLWHVLELEKQKDTHFIFHRQKQMHEVYIHNLYSMKYVWITGSNHTFLDGAIKVLNSDVGLNGDRYSTCSKHLKELIKQLCSWLLVIFRLTQRFYTFRILIFSAMYISIRKWISLSFLQNYFMIWRTYRNTWNIPYFTWFPLLPADHVTFCLQHIYCQV